MAPFISTWTPYAAFSLAPTKIPANPFRITSSSTVRQVYDASSGSLEPQRYTGPKYSPPSFSATVPEPVRRRLPRFTPKKLSVPDPLAWNVISQPLRSTVSSLPSSSITPPVSSTDFSMVMVSPSRAARKASSRDAKLRSPTEADGDWAWTV